MNSAHPIMHSDPVNEDDRLSALDRYDILDTRQEESFDRIARLIKLTLDVEIGLVSLMDAHRQWYKAVEGGGGKEVPLDVAFCRYMLEDGRAFVVPDATSDPRFRENPYVTGAAHVRSYAGAPLRTSEGFTIGSICAIGSTARDFSPREQAILAELAALAMNEIELRTLATSDGLTGVMSRRAFKDDAERFVSLAKRHRGALSCISFDLDHFKAVNDTYGHAGGDQVLVGVAKATASILRKSDLVGRLGGEEFAVLLPHTDSLHALEVADKLRLMFRGLTFPGSQPPISITASFGISTLDAAVDDLDTLLQKADEALYDAKRTGRNKCTAWRPSGAIAQADRRRVLKAGQILLNGRQSTIDCTLRSLGEASAEIAIVDPHTLPDTFVLRVVSDGHEWPCKIIARTEQRAIVAFA